MIRRVRKGGIEFTVDEESNADFWDWFESPTWEPDTVEALDLYLDSETLYVDAGAWIGDTVLLAAPHARSVIAFEPDPVARAIFLRNLDLNPSIRNVQVREEALSDRSGHTGLHHVGDAGDSLTQIGASPKGGGADATSVTQLDARQFVSDEAPSDPRESTLLKLDIEGSEYEVIPAIHRFVRDVRPHLLVSFHPNLRYRKDGLTSRLISGCRILVQNWKVLRTVRVYKHHLTWEPEDGAFKDCRIANLRRLCLPLPLRSSLLIGTYLFSDEDRRHH